MTRSDVIMTSSHELFEHIDKYVHKHDITWMKAMTYGMWAGITAEGYNTDYCDRIKSIFDHFNWQHRSSTILISYPRQCDEKIKIIRATAKRYKNIRFGFITDSHAKLYLFSDHSFIIGGCNISESTWTDFSIHIKKEHDVFNSFNLIFDEHSRSMEMIQ